nr:type IV toxin-antitoxin system YeeU family antitoxin [Pseudomonas aeruginosa]
MRATISGSLARVTFSTSMTTARWRSADRAGIRGRFSDADAYHPDQAFPLLMKQLELMLTSGELNPRHQHTVTLYAKGLTCEADTLGSCGYVYLAFYPTSETKK